MSSIGHKWLLQFVAVGLIAVMVMGLLAARTHAASVDDEVAQPYVSSAKLEAKVDPEGEEIACAVQYKPLQAFEAEGWPSALTVPCSPANIAENESEKRVRASITGLSPDTRYRYRFVVEGIGDSTFGAGGVFHTFGVETFAIDPVTGGGEPETRAGRAPHELVTRISVSHGEINGTVGPAGLVKDIMVELPPGLVGDPTAVPTCPVRLMEEEQCPGESQVGRVKVLGAKVKSELTPESGFKGRLFNVETAPGQPARIAGPINLSTNAFIDAGIRTGSDYGVNAGSSQLPIISSPFDFEIRIWGVPNSPSHDEYRRCPGVTGPCSLPPGTPQNRFLRNPTRCGEPLSARVRIESYNLPGISFTREVDLPSTTACDEVPFEPSLTVKPTTAVTDSPTGLEVELEVPQTETESQPASADLRHAVVTLPDGLTVNPASAGGLAACTPEQFGLTSPVGATPVRTDARPATCPDAAKIGSVEIDSPLLAHSLPGAVYVAKPYDNPFGSLLAIYIAVDDPKSGVVIKLAGRVDAAPDGQLTTTFEDNPQLPFEQLRLKFFAGDRAALKTPSVCGAFETKAVLTPWSAPQSGPPAELRDVHAITRPATGGSCPGSRAARPAAAQFEAGSESPLAGSFTPFVVRLARSDGTQEFSSLTVRPPRGLLARLAGIPYCPDQVLAAATQRTGTDEANAPSCPQASQIGSVVVGAGAGPRPYHVSGKTYLAGPYKGAPLSMAFVTPALAGPYDLGTVVVRAALDVDPVTAQVAVRSDPLPTQLKGIQLDLRSIEVKIDRSGFTLNPTNCEDMEVAGSLATTDGVRVPLSNRFRVGGCRKLTFKPKISLRVSGATKRAGHPALKAIVRLPAGRSSANIARAQVGLPPAHMLEQRNLRTVCTQAQLHSRSCPRGSIYGWAKAWTPLLDRPLQGPVYLGVGYGHRLPDLVADLDGQVRVLLNGRIDTTKRLGLRSTFEVVPDAPVTKFVLQMKGGKRYGLLTNKENICRKPQRASALFIGQNGKVAHLNPIVANDCARLKKASRRQSRVARHHR